MKRIKRLYYFLYFYVYALREPVHDAGVRSITLAWILSGLVVE